MSSISWSKEPGECVDLSVRVAGAEGAAKLTFGFDW